MSPCSLSPFNLFLRILPLPDLTKLLALRNSYLLCIRLIPFLLPLSVFLLVTGALWGLIYAPTDFRQGDAYRIIFIHVPAAFSAEAIYMLLSAAAFIFLIWNIKLAYLITLAAAPLGLSMAFITLMTGSLWGKPTWGVFWVWDARLTSVLLLFIIYLVIINIQRALKPPDFAAKASCIVILLGLINIPIIKFSVNWWFTLHQPASLSLMRSPTMPASMWMPLVFMITAFNLFLLCLLLMRLRNEILQAEKQNRWWREWL